MPIFTIVLCVAWALVGTILSIPYNYLANGAPENFLTTLWISPVAVLILFILYSASGVGRPHGKRPWWGGITFLVTAMYFCLPIILNGTSLLLRWTGYQLTGELVFTCRYSVLMLIPMLCLILLLLGSGVVDVYMSLRTKICKEPLQ